MHKKVLSVVLLFRAQTERATINRERANASVKFAGDARESNKGKHSLKDHTEYSEQEALCGENFSLLLINWITTTRTTKDIVVCSKILNCQLGVLNNAGHRQTPQLMLPHIPVLPKPPYTRKHYRADTNHGMILNVHLQVQRKEALLRSELLKSFWALKTRGKKSSVSVGFRRALSVKSKPYDTQALWRDNYTDDVAHENIVWETPSVGNS